MLHISKRFSDSSGIADFHLFLEKGKIHGVLGESRSGKTALSRILSGLSEPDSGTIRIDGTETRIRNPRQAAAWGIGCAGKDDPRVNQMKLTDHLVLGSEYAPSGKLRKRAARAQAAELCEKYRIPLDIAQSTEEMSRADWLWAEILRMLLQEKDILVLDEPDEVFTQQEMDQLHSVLQKVCVDGNTALIFSRHPETLLNLCGQVTLLRPGLPAETYRAKETTPNDLLMAMQCDPEIASVEKKEVSLGSIVLEARRLTVRDAEGETDPARELSFEVRGGEIVCLLGRFDYPWDALSSALIGADEHATGRIRLMGKDISRASVRERINAGIAYLPEDVRKYGVMDDFTLEENLSLHRYWEQQESGWIQRRRRQKEASDMLKAGFLSAQTDLYCFPDEMEDEELRMAVLAREMERKPLLLVAQEPFRHTSVSIAVRVRELLLSIRADHRAVLLLTSQPDEAMLLADRILVLHEGEITGEFEPAYTSARELGWYMSGQWRQQRYGGGAIEGEDDE